MTAEDERQMLDAIEKWIEKKVARRDGVRTRRRVWPTELVEDMKELGLFGALIDPEYGGLGLIGSTYSKIVTMISEEWMSLTGIFNSHLMMAQIVQRFGTDKQKAYWLPKFATGEIRGGLGLTEPDAGTDFRRSAPRPRDVGDKYVVKARRPGSQTPFKARPARFWSRPIPSRRAAL
jgi:alkylation response protein AidB-like acyl-CoA dehydrogenase